MVSCLSLFLTVTSSARWPGGGFIAVEIVFLGVLVYGFLFSFFRRLVCNVARYLAKHFSIERK